MHSITKRYRNLPAAHRQPEHQGHCRLIHGHNWGFDITFVCDKLDRCGFVIDVGVLGPVKSFLEEHFDHTLLLNVDDPLVADAPRMGGISALAKVVIVPNCGMEGLSKFVALGVQSLINRQVIEGGNRGLQVLEVVCWEDEKNTCSFKPSYYAFYPENMRRLA